MPPLEHDDLLNIMETLAEAQLQAVRKLRGTEGQAREAKPRRVKSNISIVIDILKSAGGPLHINEIIAQAASAHGRTLSRESLVSALTKRVLDNRIFCRTAPNTFDLIERGDG